MPTRVFPGGCEEKACIKEKIYVVNEMILYLLSKHSVSFELGMIKIILVYFKIVACLTLLDHAIF